MSTGVETVEVVEPWLYARLSTDPELAALVGDRVVGTLAEGDVDTPYVQFLLASTRDVNTADGTRVQVDCIYNVKAVAAGASWAQAAAVARRLDALLTLDATASTEHGDLTCTREQTVQYAEVQDGVQYRHLGAAWRIRANSH